MWVENQPLEYYSYDSEIFINVRKFNVTANTFEILGDPLEIWRHRDVICEQNIYDKMASSEKDKTAEGGHFERKLLLNA